MILFTVCSFFSSLLLWWMFLKDRDTFREFIWLMLTIFSCFILCDSLLGIPNWNRAKAMAILINEKAGTEFSTKDIFNYMYVSGDSYENKEKLIKMFAESQTPIEPSGKEKVFGEIEETLERIK